MNHRSVIYYEKVYQTLLEFQKKKKHKEDNLLNTEKLTNLMVRNKFIYLYVQ